jgi:hypothetical protein
MIKSWGETLCETILCRNWPLAMRIRVRMSFVEWSQLKQDLLETATEKEEDASKCGGNVVLKQGVLAGGAVAVAAFASAPINLDLSASILFITNLPPPQHTFRITSLRYFQSRAILIDNFISSQSNQSTGTCLFSLLIVNIPPGRRYLHRTLRRVRVHICKN